MYIHMYMYVYIYVRQFITLAQILALVRITLVDRYTLMLWWCRACAWLCVEVYAGAWMLENDRWDTIWGQQVCACILIWVRWAVLPPRCQGRPRSTPDVVVWAQTKEDRRIWSWRAGCAIGRKNWRADWYHRVTRIHVPWSCLRRAWSPRVDGHDCSRFAFATRSRWTGSDGMPFSQKCGPSLSADQWTLENA